MSKKIDRIQGAYSQLRISGLTVLPTPEDVETALYRLENMMAELNLNVHYNFEDEPDINSVTNVDRRYWQAMDTNLAIRLIPDFNKAVPPTLISQANASLSGMIGASTVQRDVQYPTRQPRGSGNTQRYNDWYRFYRPVPRAPNTPQTNRMVIGNVDDYTEHFDAYLEAGETVASYTLDADTGLTVLSQSLVSPDVLYRIRADGSGDGANSFLNVVIVATTSLDRVTTRLVNFELTGVS